MEELKVLPCGHQYHEGCMKQLSKVEVSVLVKSTDQNRGLSDAKALQVKKRKCRKLHQI
jgi:hypothetical protein